MTELESAQWKYINLLEAELNRLMTLAITHRYRPKAEDVEYGRLLRDEIKTLRHKDDKRRI